MVFVRRLCAICLVLAWINAAGALTLEECRIENQSGPGAASARCGRLAVPLRADEPERGTISLHVALVPALNLEPRRDPLFILSGGPGQSAADFYLSTAPAFARIRRDRDLVLLDQRGTGRSQRMDCPWPDDAALLQEHVRLDEQVRACLAAMPGDPRDFATSHAVRDLDAVRVALGYQRINLYAISYGTRVAQHYIRRHPTRVRSAILDGVVASETPLGPDTPRVVQQTLDAIFARCAQQVDCAERFPALPALFGALHGALARAPASLELTDPLTAKPVRIQFGVAEFSTAVRMLSYTDETASLLPLLIAENAQGRPQALASQYLMVRNAVSQQLARGMHFAVVCSEDAPRWGQDNEASSANTYLGPAFVRTLRAICSHWPRGPVDAGFFAPLRAQTPTLLLSGENDPATPPSYAATVAAQLPNSRHLVLRGQGHGQIATGCVPQLAAQFIEEGASASLDVSCLEHISAAPFLLSTTASAP